MTLKGPKEAHKEYLYVALNSGKVDLFHSITLAAMWFDKSYGTVNQI